MLGHRSWAIYWAYVTPAMIMATLGPRNAPGDIQGGRGAVVTFYRHCRGGQPTRHGEHGVDDGGTGEAVSMESINISSTVRGRGGFEDHRLDNIRAGAGGLLSLDLI